MAAFMECVKLEQVDIPRSLEILGQFAFHRCFSLQEVNMEEGNLRVIGQKAFERCFKLHTISIPSTVESLERKTFKNCDSLRVMKFQNGLKSVADEAFYSCKNLQAVALPGSVESIGLNAFAKCPKLVSLELGDGSRGAAIQNGAFEECSSLTNICLSSESRTSPSSPEDHGERINSFRGCTALEAQYGETNISLALGNRFENLPVHKKCYHASVTTADELAREIESSAQSSPQGNPTHAHLNLVDPFGMTPFHILLSAANCRLDLLQVLVDAYPPHVLGWTDAKGKTAIDYYRQQGWNLNEDSRRILQLALDGWLVGSISSWNGLEVWKSDMSSRVNAIVAAEYDVEAWKSDMWSLVNGPAILAEGKVNERERQLLIEEAPLALLRYERMEATSLLELSLWKMEMKTATGASTDNATRTTSDKDEREAYRIRCGASVLIPNVTTFLCETSLNETNRTKLIGLVIPGNPASIVTPVAGSNKSIVTEIP
ncbi:unnamed protein product [Cylindrotheca closterium]|uniref:Uncharacterized protein n=1 Tax=Cylindrotheca closterium TaxID=2856 RepID=A0AAD2PWX3_9STRA|nr:unnamed protein product [Cylindrotheca closterium]